MKNYTPGKGKSRKSYASGGSGNMSEKIQQELIKNSEIVLFKKKELVLAADELSTDIFFIPKGLMMCYEEIGEEKIVKWIRGDGNWAYAQSAEDVTFKLEEKMTGYVMVALEETPTIRISFENFRKLRDKYQENFSMMIEPFSLRYAGIMQFMHTAKFLSPKSKIEQLQYLCNFDLGRVPDVYLASWAGLSLDELTNVRELIQK